MSDSYQNVSLKQLRSIPLTRSGPVSADEQDAIEAIKSTLALHELSADSFVVTVHPNIAVLCPQN